jgi:hypothetical protein
MGKGGRPPKIAMPSDKALTLLGTSLPVGKGDEVYRFACGVIGRLAEAKGYRMAIEKDRINAVVFLGNQCIAVEVSVSTQPDDELQNIRQSLGKEYERIVIAFLDCRATERTAHLLATQLSPEQRHNIAISSINHSSQHLVF